MANWTHKDPEVTVSQDCFSELWNFDTNIHDKVREFYATAQKFNPVELNKLTQDVTV